MRNIKEWLLENQYEDVIRKIRRVEERWRKQRKRTRRNWWDVLAGHKDGSPCVIEGVRFPILRAARARKDWDSARRELSRKNSEVPLPVQPQARWAGHESFQQPKI